MVKSHGLRVRGDWPDLMQMSQGWAKAWARPWNDDFPAVALRLERGNARFLRACTELVRELATPVLSPALLPSRTSLWTDAGYEVSDQLLLLEHDLRDIPAGTLGSDIAAGGFEPADELYQIDQVAFPVRWRLGRRGLEESIEATVRTAVHRVSDQEGTTGFSVAGVGLGQGYLQRLAVHPRAQGLGHGTALVRASLLWARRHGARAVLVNTQAENERARQLYERTGFRPVPGGLVVMAAAPD